MKIAIRLKIIEFSGSTGWLDRFRSRHGIVYRKISCEAESVNNELEMSLEKVGLLAVLKMFVRSHVNTLLKVVLG